MLRTSAGTSAALILNATFTLAANPNLCSLLITTDGNIRLQVYKGSSVVANNLLCTLTLGTPFIVLNQTILGSAATGAFTAQNVGPGAGGVAFHWTNGSQSQDY